MVRILSESGAPFEGETGLDEDAVTEVVLPKDGVLQLSSEVVLRIVQIRPGSVRVGIEAPSEVVVLRGELSHLQARKARVRTILRRTQSRGPDGGPKVRIKRRKQLADT